MPPGFVLPTDYQNPEPTQLWTPLQMDPASMDHGSHGLYAAGRLKPGVTVRRPPRSCTASRGDDRTRALSRPMQFDTVVLSLADEVVGAVRRAIWLLFGAVGFLLLIACANVANLLLARAEARQREMAVRAALGAARPRGAPAPHREPRPDRRRRACSVSRSRSRRAVRRLVEPRPSIPASAACARLPVLLFTAVVAVVTSVLFSLAPALRALRVDLTDSLKDGAQGVERRRRQRFRSALVVVEMALAVVLLVGAGLMLRSLWSLQRAARLRPVGVLTMRLSLPPASYHARAGRRFYRSCSNACASLAGCPHGRRGALLPLGSTIGDFGLQVEGYVPPPGTGAKGDWQIVTDGYLEAMGERLVRGRTITAPADTPDTMLVALINEEMARRYWSGRDPIGGRMKIGGGGPNVRGSPSSASSDVRHNGITGASRRSSTCRTRSGTSRSATRSAA